MSLTRKASSAAKKPVKPPRPDLAQALAEREAELAEARRQQAATSDILRVIASSPGDLQPVLDRLAETICGLCNAYDALILLRDGDDLRFAAHYGPIPLPANFNKRRIGRDWPPGRAVADRKTIHVHDLAAARDEYPVAVQFAKDAARSAAAGMAWRTALATPLAREGEAVGAIVLRRVEVSPFTEAQIALLQTFADQAAIAIENARLFNETEEALQQQTAAAEILRVISQSPTDARPVFDRIVVTAARVLRCDLAAALLRDGDTYSPISGANAHGLLTDLGPSRIPIDRNANFPSRAILDKTMLHLPDWSQVDVPPHEQVIQSLVGAKSAIYLPLLRDDECIGVLGLLGTRPNSFGPKAIAQAESFRDQALIAIENARLFNEVQAKTRDLEESLQQQTATANVLKVISRSAFDLRTVLDTLTRSAIVLCEAQRGVIWLRRGESLRLAAHINFPEEWVKVASELAIAPAADAALVSGIAAFTGEVLNVEDVRSDPRFIALETHWVGGLIRGVLAVPMDRDGEVVGVITLSRPEARRFTERQVALVKAFADQAVIAIENVRLFDEVQAKTRDLEESLKQQTATADVLKAISRSAFDLETVLESLISTAMRLCNAKQGVIFRRHGDIYRYAASHMLIDPTYRAHEQMAEIKAGRGTLIGRVALENRTVQIADAWNDPDYAEKDEVRRGKVRSMLGVPLLRNGEPIGAFGLGREEPVPFTQRQIELVTTFADQAVIAIENVRLFDEVQARTRDLEESLEQQTATAEVLKVISRSAFDLNLATSTILEAAAKLCRAPLATLHLRDGEVCRLVTQFGLPEAFERLARESPLPVRYPLHSRRRAQAGGLAHFSDAWNDPDYLYKAGARLGGYRALVVVPLMREDELVGIFSLGRPEPEPFTQSQIKLVQTFADQAAIAIENSRLFNEVKARTEDLSEALQQQTATADVLKVISRSVFDLQTVLDTLVESAYVLCGAGAALLYLRSDDGFECKAIAGAGAEDVGHLFKGRPIRAGRSTAAERVIRTGEVHSITDLFDDPDVDPKVTAGLRGAGLDFRSTLAVPMKRDDAVVGVLVIARGKTGPFPQRQVDLLQTFADQAVIAIENVRLFDEVQAKTRDLEEALQQQTATANVLKVISRSAFDLDAVLNSLTNSAVELCNSTYGVISLYRDGVLKFMAQTGCTPEFAELLWSNPAPLDRKSTTGRAGLLRTVVLIPDVELDEEYDYHRGEIIGNYRSMMGVPLLRNGELEGVFTLMRRDPGLFTPRQVELVQTFADQAVIAIENARLFEEVQARTRDLTEALQMQTATSDVLKVISRSAFDLQTVFNTLVSSAVELGGALTGTICVRDGDVFRYRDTIGAEHTSALARYLKDHPATPGRSTIAGRVLLSGKVERIPDCLADPEYVVPMGSLATNVRSLLGVPLLRKEGVEGAIILTRAEPGEFTDRQIEIVQTFADQAVIALENVRLFDEVQARTRDLAASLDDLRKAQDRLIQSEKLASLGQLTAGIAHEIKNPLNFVNNFSALSRELVGELADVIKAAPLEDARREEAEELIGTIEGNLDKVVSHGKRADSIVKNMLLHSREGSGERSTTNVNAMVEEALNLAYHGARAEKPGFNVTIAKSLDPNAGAADLYPQEMTRVLLNLISNGFYATNKRKLAEPNGAYEPTLTASTRDLGQSVEIAIRDNGTGIADEVKAKMFNPFFTTKPAGEGTGLGLSLSHDIVVKQHGGTMEVQSAVGAFTQFIIILPRAGEGL